MSISTVTVAFGALLAPNPLFAGGGHADPVTPVLLGLVVLFAGAKLGGFLALKTGQPVVLGELLAGVLVGNLVLFGYDGLAFIRDTELFSVLASIGVILLLFEVGLESSLDEMLRVGGVAMVVAIIGVVFPFGLGYGVSAYFLSDASVYVHAFIGATLCATSVGITARVLKDLGHLKSPETKIILGAAVIDDVLGLIILAIVTGVITSVAAGGAGVSVGSIAIIAVKAFGFLAVSLVLGTRFAPTLFRWGAKMRLEGMLVALSLSFCFGMAYLSNVFGLAPIVGAFAAGVVVDGSGIARLFGNNYRSIEDLLHPLSSFFVPIFFVHMGMQVELATLMEPSVIVFGLVLTLAAIFGKQLCGLGVFGSNGRGLNRWAIGIGMIPRGEVGLIFAMIGSTLYIAGERVISSSVYSAIVIMVMLTTMITPPALKWAVRRMPKPQEAGEAPRATAQAQHHTTP